jgi:uracil-DNA glycosylase
VLLLNTVLTVEEGNSNSHRRKGWELLTNAIIKELNDMHEHLVFILWGRQAQKAKKFIDSSKHLIIESPHPSPLSAYRGFWGSKPFSRTNKYLQDHNKKPINWEL